MERDRRESVQKARNDRRKSSLLRVESPPGSDERSLGVSGCEREGDFLPPPVAGGRDAPYLGSARPIACVSILRRPWR